MADTKPDFSGWVTRNDRVCSDGKTIRHGAFRGMHNARVPLVWAHNWNDPSAILGYVDLQHRDSGVYGYAYFNDTDNGQHAKLMVQHGDITGLSIHANRLKLRGQDVLDGEIKEVSLVLAGANPGAYIEQVSFAHGDGDEVDEAIIYTGLTLEHEDKPNKSDDAEESKTKKDSEESGAKVANENNDKTVQDVFDKLTEEQKNVVYFLIGQALEDAKGGSADVEEDDDEEDDEEVEHGDGDDYHIEHTGMSTTDFANQIGYSIQEGLSEMSRNVFEASGGSHREGPTLSHSQMETILEDAKRLGSYRDSFLMHAEEYGIEDIDILFPDAKALSNTPEFLARRTEWVDEVLSKTKHSPMAKVKTVVADITADEARAKGYVKNTAKKDEIIRLLKRTTSPTTVYKKQKLDRDDIIDITDLDVVAWLKGEMRLMLDEELARAILIGDGRDIEDDDKIQDPVGAQDGAGIRSIANDHEMYAHQVYINRALTPGTLVEQALRARTHYRGSNAPVFFTSEGHLTDALLEKDKIGRRIYDSVEQLASAMRVSKIVPVEVMETDPNLVGIMVSLSDYTVGADKGGQVSMFDDFDIDWNQFKYLIETRISGGLTKPKSAVVFWRTDLEEVIPLMPSYDAINKKLVLPDVTGVEYRIDDEVVTDEYEMEDTTEVSAYPAEGYVFPSNIVTSWTFTY